MGVARWETPRMGNHPIGVLVKRAAGEARAGRINTPFSRKSGRGGEDSCGTYMEGF